LKIEQKTEKIPTHCAQVYTHRPSQSQPKKQLQYRK